MGTTRTIQHTVKAPTRPRFPQPCAQPLSVVIVSRCAASRCVRALDRKDPPPGFSEAGCEVGRRALIFRRPRQLSQTSNRNTSSREWNAAFRSGWQRHRCGARAESSTGSPRFSVSPPYLILSLERRFGVIKRVRMPVTLATRQLEAHAPERWTVRHIRHPIDAPDLALSFEHFEIFVLPVAAFAGDVGAAKGQARYRLRHYFEDRSMS
jgi:hypothetical protein